MSRRLIAQRKSALKDLPRFPGDIAVKDIGVPRAERIGRDWRQDAFASSTFAAAGLAKYLDLTKAVDLRLAVPSP